ncbi:MAG: hypothetical protein FJY65_00855 [Calditrichaeota bacterium]|nr:hypothetical protein [Calditrichota bacterium]
MVITGRIIWQTGLAGLFGLYGFLFSPAAGLSFDSSQVKTQSAHIDLIRPAVSLDFQGPAGDYVITSSNSFYLAQPDAADKIRSQRQGRAFIQSLLIPGLGQWLDGRKTKAYLFFTAEAVLLGGIIGSRLYAGWLVDDYRQFARQHAGVSAERDHQFYVDIGNWMNQQAFNEQRLRDRQFDRLYDSSEDAWQWDTDANRSHFKSIRLYSDRLNNQALMFVGGLLLNHFLSAIDAASGGKEGSNKLSVAPSQIGCTPALKINWGFGK